MYAWAKAATKPSYTWGEIGGKPSVFTPAAHKHPLSDISDLHASWDALLKAAPSAYVTRWPAWGEVTGKPSSFTPAEHTHVKADITDFPTSWAWSAITGKPSTLAGYGIKDGVNSVTASGGLSASVSGHKLTVGVASGYAVPTSAQIGGWNLVASLFGVDSDGNVYVKGGKGFYGTSFVSSRGSDPEAGQGGGTGVDMDSVWDALAAGTSEQINASHIPALNISKITGLQSALDSKLNNASTAYDTAYARGFQINGTTYTLWAITNPGTIGPFFAPSSPGTNGYILQSKGGVPAWMSRAALTQQLFSGYKGCESIPENSDLNDYTTPGLYFCPANATVQTLANVPVTGAFSLAILQAAGVIQILREYGYSSNANEYTRRYYNGSWTTWVRAPRLDELYRKTEADGRYLKLSGGTMTGKIVFSGATNATSSIKMSTDTSNYRVGVQWESKNEGTKLGEIGYWNARQRIYLNALADEVTDVWTDSVGKYSLVVGKNLLTYNTYPLLHSANYTNYTVTKTGGGASGTWGINISGNATSATNATYAQRANYLYGEYTGSGGTQPPSYFKNMGLKVNMMGKPVVYSDVIVVNGYNVGADVPYINAIGFQKTANDHGEVYHARGDYGGDSWGTWYKFLDEYNYAGILDSHYLLKSAYTASDILTKLKTVDGSGSGLDADLLDGTQKSGLLTSVASTAATNLSVTVGGTVKSVADLYATYLDGYNNYNTITVGGDADTYYPVVIQGPSVYYPALLLNITRTYNETAPDSWNTSTHKGGLTLCILWNSSKTWDGNGSGDTGTTNVLMLRETYCTMVGGMTSSTSGLVVWLRGGTATYHIYSDRGVRNIATVYLNGFTDLQPKTFSPTKTPSSISSFQRLSVTATTATKLATARTLWGQSFDGTANVSGNMTGVGSITATGNVSLSATSGVGLMIDSSLRSLSWTVNTSGVWARTLRATDPTGETVLMNVAGIYGRAQTPDYVYMGGTSYANAPFVVTAAGTVGIGTTSPNYKLDVRGTGYFSGVLGANGMTLPYGGSSWITMASTPAVLQGSMNQSSNSAHPLFRVKNSSGDAIVFGGLGSNTGFYGFTAERISSGGNNYDWATTWNVGTGLLTHNGAMTVGGLLTASGGLTTPQYVQVGSGRLRWDAANNALYVEKSDGTACGLYSKGYMSARGSDPEAATGGSSELVPVVYTSKLTVGTNVSISVLASAGLTNDVLEKMRDGAVGRIKAVFSDGSTEIWPVLHASENFISFGYDTVAGGYQDTMDIYEITIPSKTSVIRVEHFER